PRFTPPGDLGRRPVPRELDPESRVVLCVVAHFAFLDGGLMAQAIGFIGLGIMGRPMAKNLLKAGYPLVVHSRSRAPVDELVRAGATAAASPRDVAARCEVLITMLPNSPDVELVALAKEAGLDRELTLTALAGGLAGSRCLDQKRPNYVANAYTPGFKIDLHYKDLGLIMDSARALGVPLPTTAVVQELFNALRVKGR